MCVCVRVRCVCAACAGLVHRDLKAADLLMGLRSDGSVRVLVGDLGRTRALDADSTHRTAGVGTPATMAPEVAMGRCMSVCVCACVYVCACVVCVCVCYRGVSRWHCLVFACVLSAHTLHVAFCACACACACAFACACACACAAIYQVLRREC